MSLIELRNVSLDYPVLGLRAKSLRQTVLNLTVGGRLFRGRDDSVVIQALSGVSLTVEEGQRVGLYGHNGSGKTTLLRVMAGIYAPSAGLVQVNGTVSAVFNVSLGMDAEASGKENIYLLARYRGYRKAEIEREFESICNFTELGAYLDMPVKYYSAGMTMRLAFAVATSFKPDILLLDEWLFAGDAQFIAKATDRMTSFASQARALVLATHSKDLLRSICDRVLVMEHGKIIADGRPDEVLS